MFYSDGMVVARIKQILETNLLVFDQEQRQVQAEPYKKGWTHRRTLKCIYEIKPTLRFYPSLLEESMHRLLGTRSPVLASKCGRT